MFGLPLYDSGNNTGIGKCIKIIQTDLMACSFRIRNPFMKEVLLFYFRSNVHVISK